MKSGKVDKPFLIALLILIGFGLLMVFSASMYSATVENPDGNGYDLFLKQALFVALGIGAMYLVSRIDYHLFDNKRLTFILMGLSLVLLILVLVVGVTVNDAKRWISLGFTNFQPSELAKFAGILYLTSLISREPEVLTNFKLFSIKCILPILLLCGVTAIEPSLSAALAIGAGMFFVLFLGGARLKYFLPYIGLAALAVTGLMIAEPWRIERLNVFLGKGGYDYQITQSLLAIGSGGIFGRGLGNGKQKLLFLPELQNDFIFANVGEELGLVGCLLLIGLFVYIIVRGYKIANTSKDRFGYLYTASTMSLLGFQVLVNIAVATNVLPVTGMALPFVSAGGSSMIVLFVMVGPILNLSRGFNKRKRRR